MKRCVALFAAVLLVGAASSVTMGWTSKEGATSFDGFKDAGGELLGFKGEFTVTVKFTYTGTGTPGTYFKFLTGSGTLGQGALTMTGRPDNAVATITSYSAEGRSNSGNTRGDFSETRLKGENPGTSENTLTLTFGQYDAETGNYGTATYDIVFANGNHETNTLGSSHNLGPDYVYWQGAELGEGVALTGVTVEANDVVPEPTALALLALGVAGLALRRRVA